MSEGRFHYQQDSAQDNAHTASDTEQYYYRTEEFTVPGDKIVAKVIQILRDGNALRITIKDQKNNILFEVPMVIGVVGTILFPSVAILGVLGALATNLRVTVERKEKIPTDQNIQQSPSGRKRRVAPPRDSSNASHPVNE